MQLLEVFQLAANLHQGQVDKAGMPYIEHLTRVLLRVQLAGGSLHQQMAALLHDSIEDGKTTADQLLTFGVPVNAVELVQHLTRQDEETYLQYIQRVKLNAAVVLIKLADLDDNGNPQRLALLPTKDADRLRSRYAQAVGFLTNI